MIVKTRVRCCALLLFVAALASCSREDSERTKHEIRRDLKDAKQKAQEGAHEASREIKKGVGEIKRELGKDGEKKPER